MQEFAWVSLIGWAACKKGPGAERGEGWKLPRGRMGQSLHPEITPRTHSDWNGISLTHTIWCKQNKMWDFITVTSTFVRLKGLLQDSLLCLTDCMNYSTSEKPIYIFKEVSITILKIEIPESQWAFQSQILLNWWQTYSMRRFKRHHGWRNTHLKRDY